MTDPASATDGPPATELPRATAALLREAIAGGLRSTSFLDEARASGEDADIVDALTIMALHHLNNDQHDLAEPCWTEATTLERLLPKRRPIVIRWQLATMGGALQRFTLNLEATSAEHRRALELARGEGFDYGVRRSLMNLSRTEFERGHNGEAFRLLCEVRDSPNLDQVEQGHVHHLVGDQLLEMRAPDLAHEQYERSLDFLPRNYRRRRMFSMATIVVALCEHRDLERAEVALDRFEKEFASVPWADVRAIGVVATAHVASLGGRYDDAIDMCARWREQAAAYVSDPMIMRWTGRVWAKSLNDVGRFAECIERWAPAVAPENDLAPEGDVFRHDDRIHRQLARAYEATGEIRAAYLHEVEANRIAAARLVSFPAAIELVEVADFGLAIRRGSSELARANEQIRRIGGEIEYIIEQLLGDVSTQLDELIERFEESAARDHEPLDRAAFEEPMNRLQHTLALLRRSERPVTNEGTADVRALLEHACRACESFAVKHSVRLVRCPTVGEARTDWAMLATWTSQIRAAIAAHSRGSELRVVAGVGARHDMADADVVLEPNTSQL